jgi:hypothetical protein
MNQNQRTIILTKVVELKEVLFTLREIRDALIKEYRETFPPNIVQEAEYIDKAVDLGSRAAHTLACSLAVNNKEENKI